MFPLLRVVPTAVLEPLLLRQQRRLHHHHCLRHPQLLSKQKFRSTSSGIHRLSLKNYHLRRYHNSWGLFINIYIFFYKSPFKINWYSLYCDIQQAPFIVTALLKKLFNFFYLVTHSETIHFYLISVHCHPTPIVLFLLLLLGKASSALLINPVISFSFFLSADWLVHGRCLVFFLPFSN